MSHDNSKNEYWHPPKVDAMTEEEKSANVMAFDQAGYRITGGDSLKEVALKVALIESNLGILIPFAYYVPD